MQNLLIPKDVPLSLELYLSLLLSIRLLCLSTKLLWAARSYKLLS